MFLIFVCVPGAARMRTLVGDRVQRPLEIELVKTGGRRDTVRALIQKPLRSGQGPWVSGGFGCSWSFSVGLRPVPLPSRPYLKFCGSVAVFLSAEASLYISDRSFFVDGDNLGGGVIGWAIRGLSGVIRDLSRVIRRQKLGRRAPKLTSIYNPTYLQPHLGPL